MDQSLIIVDGVVTSVISIQSNGKLRKDLLRSLGLVTLGFHRYFFKLYALNSVLDFEGVGTREKVIKSMGGKILGQAEAMGRYER